MKGEGTVTSHSSGMVRASISLGTVNGRRERLTSYHHDKRAAEAWLVRQRGLLARGDRLPSKLPLGEWLAEWLQREARDVAPATHRDYAKIVADLPGWLAAQPLGKLSPAHIQAWLDELARPIIVKRKGKDTAILLSPRTMALRRNVLRAALNDAMRRELVDRNAAALAQPPRQRRPKRTVLTGADCAAILRATASWRYHAAVAVSIGTGIRRGELLGLVWGDVERDRIIVRQRLRREDGEYVIVDGTKASEQPLPVPLPAFAREALDAWKIVQDAERAAAGDNVEPLDGSVPVFTTPKGQHVHGSLLTHQFQDILEAAKLPRIAWHDMRHATADMLAAAGVDQSTARDYLRHASVVTTQDHYTGTAWASLVGASLVIQRAIGE